MPKVGCMKMSYLSKSIIVKDTLTSFKLIQDKVRGIKNMSYLYIQVLL